MRWGAGGARCAQPAPRPSLGSEFQAAPLRLRPQPKAKRLLILSGGAFSSLPERLSQGPSLGRKRYSKEPLKPVLTFQHFLSACRPAKSGSKRALRKVDRSPAQTIPEPVKATLAPGILSELGPSSKPESARAPRRQVWPGPPLTLAPRPGAASGGWLDLCRVSPTRGVQVRPQEKAQGFACCLGEEPLSLGLMGGWG